MRNTKTLPIFTTLLLVAILAITANLFVQSTSIKPNTLYIEPEQLFTGEANKYAAFVDGTYGAVKMKYKGSKKEITIKGEIWENGVLTKTNPLMGGVLLKKINEHEYQFDGDCVLLIREIKNPETGNIRFAFKNTLTEGTSLSSAEFAFDTKFKLAGKGNIQLNKSIEIRDDEETAIWGMQATDEDHMETMDFTPEPLKRTKFAMIFKVYLK
ncbi:hypothetical protein [Paenibacillus sp. KN14-4R]|uniref:hypothetical protein n=1 Tax=Paenibacillus sp. KN14-4R TaxID=3445773 RepID=UPI003FA0830E